MIQTNNGKLNILVAEDIDSNYMLVKAILRDFNLTRAINGVEAVELCRANTYDVIFMDINMPKMDGLEATRQIRTFDRKTPIIALTANAFDSDRIDAMNAGCNDFLTKPIYKATILESIGKWTQK